MYTLLYIFETLSAVEKTSYVLGSENWEDLRGFTRSGVKLWFEKP